jgi:toxin FitB
VIILDTNVVSELMRPAPSPLVVEWVQGQNAGDLYTTAITLAEIGYGIDRLPDSARKSLLAATSAQVFSSFADHVLAFDADAASLCGGIVGDRDRRGVPIDGFDAQIAAICLRHAAALSTRNVKDFEQTGISVIDPWSGG